MKVVRSYDESNRQIVFKNKINSSDKMIFFPPKDRHIIVSICKDPGLPEHQQSPTRKFLHIFEFFIKTFISYFPLILFSKLPPT